MILVLWEKTSSEIISLGSSCYVFQESKENEMNSQGEGLMIEFLVFFFILLLVG